jgi:hypothetical protein
MPERSSTETLAQTWITGFIHCFSAQAIKLSIADGDNFKRQGGL